jgi:hypothetical protein
MIGKDCFLCVTGMWLARLQRDLNRSQRAAFATGTVKNLKSQWNKFRSFCHLSQDYTLPVSTERLCLYVQFLSRSLAAPQSFRNYISGLKTLHKLLELAFPSLSSVQVKLTFRGLDKLVKHVPRQAFPVDPTLLLDLSRFLHVSDPVDMVFFCLFLF